MKATSRFGAEFDSFADLVAFGIAPAALVLHFVWLRYEEFVTGWITMACGGYALLAALRLARFNSVAPVQAGWFRGVPSTACGALVATGTLVLMRYDGLLALDWPLYLALLMTALGIAMISSLRFPKLGLMSSRLMNIPHLANLLGLYICGSLRVWPEYLFAASMLIVVAGLTAGLLKRPTS